MANGDRYAFEFVEEFDSQDSIADRGAIARYFNKDIDGNLLFLWVTCE